MKQKLVVLVFGVFLLLPQQGHSQFDEGQMGGWYMYFFNSDFENSPWGFQGDVQHRNWNAAGDLEQLLLRGGLTYRPQDTKLKLTLGYGHITSGAFGSDDATSSESRIYQELLFPFKIADRLYTNHRLRYEQRFVENQDFRTRYRYNFFLNIPLNNAVLTDQTFYLAFYNELFINGQKNIGDGRKVKTYDRNRLYIALGYMIKKGLKVQAGIMNQDTQSWNKNQLQLSCHHSF